MAQCVDKLCNQSTNLVDKAQVEVSMTKNRILLIFLALALCTARASSQEKANQVYQNAGAPISERVRDLLSQMTLEEKVAQLESGVQYPTDPEVASQSFFDHDRLNEPLVRKSMANGLGTFAFLDEFTNLTPLNGSALNAAKRRNLLQSWVLKNTRLGIPIMFHGEALHGAVIRGATSFPQAVALGSTWDPDLLQKMFTAVAIEARAQGNTLILGPVFDLSRDPRYGRVEEMYSEDPYLVGELGVAAVHGLQGDSDKIDSEHVFATAKHFVHAQPENGTNSGPADFSERTLRSIFLYPFEQAVRRAHIEAVMPSYNETMGGIPSNANPWLLKTVLRSEWGFTGLTVSDYTAVEQLFMLHHVASDKSSAGVLAFSSGVDMELPSASGFPGLIPAVRAGNIPEEDLNKAVGRILDAKFRAGLFDHPYVDEERAVREIGNPVRSTLARHVADEAIVLLKNQGKLLPLDSTKIKTLAVIGPNGNKVRLGSYSGIPTHYSTILDGIQKRVDAATSVVFAEGCRISEPDSAPNSNGFLPYKAPSEEVDRKLMEEAVRAAEKADVVVLALGGNEAISHAATGDPVFGDSDTLELPGRQNELVAKIAAFGKPMVAVLLNGKAYSIGQITEMVPAIIEGWYLGQETGNAVADVLFGDVNPSGHLPVSIARNVGQLPVYYYKTPAARLRYVFDENTPLYPFGIGLSYTTFSFGQPSVDRETLHPSDTAKVSVTVTNTGDRAGDEVVQMYIHHEVSSVVRPVIILRGFKRIHLEPNQSTTVTFDVGPEQLSILNAEMQRVVEPGVVDIQIGPSSVETSKTQVTIAD
jgi:beta-glucosidase